MKKNTKPMWTVVFTSSIVLVICALGLLCWYLFGMYTSGRENVGLTMDIPPVSSNADDGTDVKPSSSFSGSLKDSEVDTSKKKPAKASTDSDTKTKTKKAKDSDTDTPIINGNINFTDLWKINKDIYAWIRVPNTAIDYPILQTSGDDAFYLEHNLYGQYSFAGSIYTEKLNSKDFEDPNTVIYGHNLLNGTMFASLHNFRNPDFFANNEYFYIYLPNHTLTYRIFAAYEYDDRHLMYSFNYNDEEEFARYLEYAQNPENSMTYNIRECGVTTDNTIVTLSTCMDNISTSRYLVQGVLILDEVIER